VTILQLTASICAVAELTEISRCQKIYMMIFTDGLFIARINSNISDHFSQAMGFVE
jgi:hypothetical protein